MSLLDLIDFDSKNVALINPISDMKIRYDQLCKAISTLSFYLSKKFNYENVCLILLENGIDFSIAFFASYQSGLIAAPVNPNYNAVEIFYFIKRIKPALIITSAELSKSFDLREKLQNINLENNKKLNICLIESNCFDFEFFKGDSKNFLKFSVDFNMTVSDYKMPFGNIKDSNFCLQLFTSGTTSEPKCVRLSRHNLSFSAKNIAKSLKLTQNDTTLVVMPLFHVHGLIGVLLSTLISGGTAILPNKFSASKFWQSIYKYECSWYSAAPTIHNILLKTFKNFDDMKNDEKNKIKEKLRFIRSCSSALSKQTFLRIEELLNVPFLQAYAMTEASHQVCTNRLPPFERSGESVGIPMGVEIAILDKNKNLLTDSIKNCDIKGEILVRGETIIKEYSFCSIDSDINKKSFFGEYFRTGDLGYFGKNGHLYLCGRLKELINRGGEKISPFEVEEKLREIKGVQEVGVFPEKDEIYGETVCAAVVCDIDYSNLEQKLLFKNQIEKYCKENLTEFKIPKNIYFLKELPKNSTGKLQRRKIAEAVLK